MSTLWIDLEDDRIPDDPDAAFAYVERVVRGKFEAQLSLSSDEEVPPMRLLEGYMFNVVAAARVYGIAEVSTWSLPDREQAAGWRESVLLDFMNAAGLAATECELRFRRRRRDRVVALDATARTELQDWIAEARNLISSLDLTLEKRDELRRLLNDFQRAVDREITWFDAVGAWAVGVSRIAGQAGKEIKPLTDRICELLDAARGRFRQISSDPEPKRIEDKRSESSGDIEPADDDLPF